MPTNKKESLIFGIMMCFGMVCIMSTYNLLSNHATHDISISTIILEFTLALIVAFLLDVFIVGPVAKKIAFKIPFDKSKKINVILAMTTCMVIGMVLCMSAFGFILSGVTNGFDRHHLISAYLLIALKNFIFAYPLQLLVMGPLVRTLFTKCVKHRMA
ncbi:DUF2798 domain-containing protein [Bacillus sp. NPDC077027]|uniref:DUF2798 domain-containing protein n=1 Tax=Bacillus sp. NPDC077027 TaxID=3390548 RepID=UPI003D07EA52